MRRLAYPAAILILLASATSAYAGAGLPKLASFKAGAYQVGVHVDSLVPRVGTNVLTLEAANLPEGALVEMKLLGPGGQTITVPWNPLTVQAGPDGGHGGDDHGAATDDHAAATDDHGTAADGHGAAADSHGAAADSHGTAATDQGAAAADHDAAVGHVDASGALNLRGKVKLNQTGDWTAVLKIHGAPEGDLTAEAPFAVEKGGPSRAYLAFTGLAMGGTAIYAAINRRKGANTGR